ncbi:MAG: hypothetical protein ABI847_08520 [Anaerolineales bacterium]
MPSLNRNVHYAVLAGLALGFGIAVGFLPGGYDAFTFYLRLPNVDTTAPAWVYLVTFPISLLGWPLGWQFLTFISILIAGAAGMVWSNNRWWIVFVTTPMVWNIWLGQIEVFPMAGLLLTGLVVQKRIHPAWLGVSWLALLSKPQVGLGILIMQLVWVWGDAALGKRALAYGVGVSAALFALTVLIWPGWVPNWLMTMRTFAPTWWNAAIWPYGLLAWPVALLASHKAGPRQKLRLFSAASLLGSPYFAVYHCATLLTVTDSLLAILLSWGIVLLGRGLPEHWMRWGWLLPAGLLAYDLAARWFAPSRGLQMAADTAAAEPAP